MALFALWLDTFQERQQRDAPFTRVRSVATPVVTCPAYARNDDYMLLTKLLGFENSRPRAVAQPAPREGPEEGPKMQRNGILPLQGEYPLYGSASARR